jgi:ubiquitin C-terminal hydrolase
MDCTSDNEELSSPHIDSLPSPPFISQESPSETEVEPELEFEEEIQSKSQEEVEKSSDEEEKASENSSQQMEQSVARMRARYQIRPRLQKPEAVSLPPDISEADLKGILGIANLGNTCYANSTLQILRACGNWSAHVLSENFTPDDRKEMKILLGYKDLLQSLWSASRPGFVRPYGWMNMIRECVKDTVWDMFAMPIQNDAHEFLVYLLDMFHEALKVKSTNSNSQNKIPSRKMWNNFMLHNNSKVADLFFGLMKKTVRCETCGRFSDSYEPFNILKIDCLDSDKPFQEWMKNCFKVEELEDYACELCSPTRTKATIHLTLCRIPKNLFICLKRFTPNGRKNMNGVPEANTVDLNPFFEPSCAGVTGSGFDSVFQLRGIVDHHGSHMGGHYTAQFCSPLNGHWWWMDDESSLYLPTPRFGASNYMYLYTSEC